MLLVNYNRYKVTCKNFTSIYPLDTMYCTCVASVNEGENYFLTQFGKIHILSQIYGN